MVQQQQTPSPPKKIQRIHSPLQDLSRVLSTDVRATKEYPLHKKYDLDDVLTDKLENRNCRYVIIRAYRQQWEKENINVDLPAYYKNTWFFAKGPTSKSYYREHYEDIKRRFKKAKPCGNSVYWYDMLDWSSKSSDRTAPRIQKISPSCPWCCLPDKRLVLYEPFRMVASVYWYDMLDWSSKSSDQTALWIQKISPSCPWCCLPDKRLVLYEPFRMVAWLCEIPLCTGNTHVLKLLSFDWTSKFWNLQTLTFMHWVQSEEVVRTWIMCGHRFKPRSRVN